MDRKVKLNGVAITGQTLLYTKIPNLILGDDAGYQRGDILDANAVALKINEVIGGAPEALDTLKELADAMQDNPQLITDMKNQIDPFFTPNQNNKIDTYDELKAFFNDTPPVYTYTKRETDPKPWRNMSYYNHNYRTTTLSSVIAETLLQYGRGWVELKKDGLTYSGFCTVCPNGTIEYEYEMDIEGTTNRLCFEVDSIGSGGKLYGEIPLEDGFVCDLYTVTQEVHFETFEERLQGFFDPNTSGKIDTLDVLRPFLDGSEILSTEYITLPPPRNFESDEINGESGVWISDENEDPIKIQSNVAPEEILLNMSPGVNIGGYSFMRIEDTGDYYTYTYFSSIPGLVYTVAKIYVAKYNIPNTQVQAGDIFFVLQPNATTSALSGILAIIYDNKYNDGEIKSLSNIIDTKLDKTYVTPEINPNLEGIYSFIRLDNGQYTPQIMLYCVNPNVTPIAYSGVNVGVAGVSINSTNNITINSSGVVYAQSMAIHPKIYNSWASTSISCGNYYNYSDVTSPKSVSLSVPSSKDVVGTIYIHVKFTGGGAMTFTSSDSTIPIKYSDWTTFTVGNEYEIIARYVKTAWILSNHVLT